MEHLLEVKNLSVSIDGPAGEVQAVRDVSFSLKRGEVLAIVEESGCGKSVLCKSIMKLLPPSAKIKEGSICVNGQDITCYREREMQKLRGRVFAMIFQDPMTSLNPTIKIGKQIAEAVLIHNKNYLFADEPTTALDVTIQAQILDLLREIQMKLGTATILVSHDLGVVARVADRVAVMYAGKIVEIGTVEEVYYDPRHPYTWGLMRSLPAFANGKESLYTIPGMPPALIDPPKGDAFACRNEYALNIDYEEMPPMFKITDTHYAATWLLDPRAPQIKSPVGGIVHE